MLRLMMTMMIAMVMMMMMMMMMMMQAMRATDVLLRLGYRYSTVAKQPQLLCISSSAR
jgi:hypothetical protein